MRTNNNQCYGNDKGKNYLRPKFTQVTKGAGDILLRGTGWLPCRPRQQFFAMLFAPKSRRGLEDQPVESAVRNRKYSAESPSSPEGARLPFILYRFIAGWPHQLQIEKVWMVGSNFKPSQEIFRGMEDQHWNGGNIVELFESYSLLNAKEEYCHSTQ